MNKKILSKLTALTVVGGISTSCMFVNTTNVFAKEINSESRIELHQVSNSEFEEMKNEISKYLVLNSDGTIGLSLKMPRSYNYEYNLDGLYKHFDMLNEKVKSGEISINADFSINQKQTRAGQTCLKYYWWGTSGYYSYSNARREIVGLKNAAIAGTGVATVGGLTGNLIASVGGTITATYCAMLAHSMEEVNSNNGQRGIVVDINWVLAYSVYSQ